MAPQMPSFSELRRSSLVNYVWLPLEFRTDYLRKKLVQENRIISRYCIADIMQFSSDTYHYLECRLMRYWRRTHAIFVSKLLFTGKEYAAN